MSSLVPFGYLFHYLFFHYGKQKSSQRSYWVRLGKKTRKPFWHLALLGPLFLRHGGKEGLAFDKVRLLLQSCVICKGSREAILLTFHFIAGDIEA